MAIRIRRGTNAQWEANKGNIVSGEPVIATDTGRFFVGTGTGKYIELAKVGKTGITDDLKQALLTLAANVAYTNGYGQEYYDALEEALYSAATLVAINAVYTQSGSVYSTTSLNDLRSDLVVTAVYDDGSTATVSGYTLTGTLAVGTSTITVTFGGMTDTFDVTVSEEPLPSGYTAYDYISNTTSLADNNNRIINTGINSSYCDDGYVHEIVFYIPSMTTSGTNGIWGSRNASGSAGTANGNSIWLHTGTQNMITVGYQGVDSGFTIPCTFGAKHTVKLDSGDIYVDGTVVSSPTGTRTSYDTTNIRLFGVGQGTGVGGSCKVGDFRFYSYKLTRKATGEVIAYLVPCTNSNNVAGMFDKIAGEFRSASDASYYTCGNDA